MTTTATHVVLPSFWINYIMSSNMKFSFIHRYVLYCMFAIKCMIGWKVRWGTTFLHLLFSVWRFFFEDIENVPVIRWVGSDFWCLLIYSHKVVPHQGCLKWISFWKYFSLNFVVSIYKNGQSASFFFISPAKRLPTM